MHDLLKTDVCYSLVLDKRLSDFRLNVEPQLKNAGIKTEMFIVGGCDAEDITYSRCDIDSLPPVYENTTTYPTWMKTPAPYNAFLSHQAILRKALDQKANSILLLEDDIEICDDFTDILNNAAKQLVDLGIIVDMLYLGSYNNKNTYHRISDNLLRLNGSAGFHGVAIYNKKIMEELSRAAPIGPMDEYCGKYIHSRAVCVGIYPSIIIQKSGYSHIEHCHLTKPDRYFLGNE